MCFLVREIGRRDSESEGFFIVFGVDEIWVNKYLILYIGDYFWCIYGNYGKEINYDFFMGEGWILNVVFF